MKRYFHQPLFLWLNYIFLILFGSSLLFAQNASITIDGGGASITITSNGYLIHGGGGEGEIIVNSGASLSTWSPTALIDFTVTGREISPSPDTDSRL